jgi:predicted lysophospholipase L1 biosynthesis ABC-type transport system permease subunit
MVNVITVDQQHTSKAVQFINAHFPLASTQTVSDALNAQQEQVDTVKKFLDIAGLMALLIGGAIGSLAAIGMSYLVRGLVQQTFRINIPFALDPLTIGGGILIGLVTALIFGLMPIVQAANIRPLSVIRELPGGGGKTARARTLQS